MRKLKESFEVNDLINVLIPKLHIDEFVSKIGKDNNIAVVSFLVNDKQAALDLVNFFEVGYDFILDADISESEITVGSYLVFVEILRRHRLIDEIFQLLSDLSAASQLNINDWTFRYMNEEDYYPCTAKEFKQHIPLSPRAYSERFNKPVEDIKQLAGLKTESFYVKDELIETIMHNAGIYHE